MENRDEGSLGSCFSHVHTRPSTSEAAADKNEEEGRGENNKQIMFMDGGENPTHLMAMPQSV